MQYHTVSRFQTIKRFRFEELLQAICANLPPQEALGALDADAKPSVDVLKRRGS
jgi:hypothetical protein